MKKILVSLSFFAVSIVFVGCDRQTSDPVDEIQHGAKQAKTRDESTLRVTPFYTYNLTTTNQSNPTEYYVTSSGGRVFYLKASASYVRSCTLTVLKTVATTTDNPNFRVYGSAGQCLKMSTPTVSSGTVTPTGIFQQQPFPGFPDLSGHSWTPTLGASAINSTATLTFNVYPEPNTSCVEGFIAVDMTDPSLVVAAGNYSDFDNLYFVKNNSL